MTESLGLAPGDSLVPLVYPLSDATVAHLRVRCRLILTGSAGLQEGAAAAEGLLFFGRDTEYTEGVKAGPTTVLRNEPIVVVREVEFVLHDEEANT